MSKTTTAMFDDSAGTAKTLLLVDDEKTLLLTLSFALRHQDPTLNIMTAEDGRIARSLIEMHRIDLVITDLCMPVMDGFALIKYIKEQRPGTPVIAMTGSPLEDVEPRLTSLGVPICLEKSVDFYGFVKDMAAAAASEYSL